MPVRDEKPERLKIDHVARSPLPWRTIELTECGLPVEAHPVITRDSYLARLREWGQDRTRFTVCRTCAQTAANYKTWEEDPVNAIQREAHRHGFFAREADGGRDLFTRELRALTALVEAHREEFDAYVEGLTETTSLDAVRRAKRRRGAS
jgi:hypothetical protein